VLRRLAAKHVIDASRGKTGLEFLGALALERHAHGDLMARAWELRHHFSAYDAAYVALAELLRAKLLTRDQRLATAASSYADVILVQTFINCSDAA
jgi:predicted nucleic acid-binding protein